MRSELLAPLNARLAPPIRIAAQRIVAEDDLVVVEARGHNTTRAGEAYNNEYCFVFRLAAGKLAAVTEYMDMALAERVLGRADKAMV